MSHKKIGLMIFAKSKEKAEEKAEQFFDELELHRVNDISIFDYYDIIQTEIAMSKDGIRILDMFGEQLDSKIKQLLKRMKKSVRTLTIKKLITDVDFHELCKECIGSKDILNTVYYESGAKFKTSKELMTYSISSNYGLIWIIIVEVHI